MKHRQYDIVIAGGGASGIVAAMCAKKAAPALKIVIIEKKDSLGRKLRATGNGRCNLSNIQSKDYQGTLAFFETWGIRCRIDHEGRIYPFNESAADFLAVLTTWIKQLKIEVVLNSAIKEIEQSKKGYILKTEDAIFHTKKVLMAMGGKAGPAFGSTGEGLTFARNLGHTIITPFPILTAVEIQNPEKNLAGVRSKGSVTLIQGQQVVFTEKGEIQFTAYGLSGICIFNLTRFLKVEKPQTFKDYTIELAFYGQDDMQNYLEKQYRENPHNQVHNLMRGILKEKVSSTLLKRANIRPEKAVGKLNASEIKKMSYLVSHFVCKPTGVKGWQQAQCTAGGVALKDIDLKTMASKKCDGLYFSGEITEFGGPCGGFNLDFAWQTGIRAGQNMVKAIKEKI